MCIYVRLKVQIGEDGEIGYGNTYMNEALVEKEGLTSKEGEVDALLPWPSPWDELLEGVRH